MPAAIRIELWCDACESEQIETLGEWTPVVTMGNAQPRRIILCEAHRKEMLDPFRELLLSPVAEVVSAGNAQPAAPERSEGRFACPFEDCERHAKPYAGMDTLRKHLVRRHDKSREEANAMTNAGSYVPAVKEVACPVEGCGQEYNYPTYKRPTQAMGVHLAKVHGVMGGQYTPDGKGAKDKRHGVVDPAKTTRKANAKS